MGEENFQRTGHTTHLKMYDVKQKKFVENVPVELVVLSNGRYAVTGTNPETGMKMFKLISKALAQQISGEVEI